MIIKMTFKTKSVKVLTRLVNRAFKSIDKTEGLCNFSTVRLAVGESKEYNRITAAKKVLVYDLLAHQREFYWHEEIKVDIDSFAATGTILVTAF